MVLVGCAYSTSILQTYYVACNAVVFVIVDDCAVTLVLMSVWVNVWVCSGMQLLARLATTLFLVL